MLARDRAAHWYSPPSNSKLKHTDRSSSKSVLPPLVSPPRNASDDAVQGQRAASGVHSSLCKKVKCVDVTIEDLQGGLTPVSLIYDLFGDGHRGVQLDVHEDVMFKIRFDAEITNRMRHGFLDELKAVLREPNGKWKSVATKRYQLERINGEGGTKAGAYILHRKGGEAAGGSPAALSVPLEEYVRGTPGEPPSELPTFFDPHAYLSRKHFKRLSEPVAEDHGEAESTGVQLSKERIVYANDLDVDGGGSSIMSRSTGGTVPGIKSDLDTMLGNEKITGVNTWFFNVTRENSIACMHVENLSMYSINYMLPNSATKVWLGFHQRHMECVNRILADMGVPCSANGGDAGVCPNLLRHRYVLLDEEFFLEHNIPYFVVEQDCTEAIVTLPGGFHQTIATGVSYSEAINFIVYHHWLKVARETLKCYSWCKDQDDEKGRQWQPIKDVLYGTERDFIVGPAEARAMYPRVQLNCSLKGAYRDSLLEEPPASSSASQPRLRGDRAGRTSSLTELLRHTLETKGNVSVEEVLEMAAEQDPENEETQGSLQRERKRKRKQRTNAALKAKKMKEAVAKRQQQQESLDAQEEDNQEHETEPPTAKIERKSRTTDREHPAPQVPTPRQTQVVRPLQATRQPLQPGKESFMKEIARVQVRVQTAIDGIGHVRLAVILSRLFDLGIDPLKVQSAGALDEDTLHLAKQRVRQMIATDAKLLWHYMEQLKWPLPSGPGYDSDAWFGEYCDNTTHEKWVSLRFGVCIGRKLAAAFDNGCVPEYIARLKLPYIPGNPEDRVPSDEANGPHPTLQAHVATGAHQATAEHGEQLEYEAVDERLPVVEKNLNDLLPDRPNRGSAGGPTATAELESVHEEEDDGVTEEAVDERISVIEKSLDDVMRSTQGSAGGGAATTEPRPVHEEEAEEEVIEEAVDERILVIDENFDEPIRPVHDEDEQVIEEAVDARIPVIEKRLNDLLTAGMTMKGTTMEEIMKSLGPPSSQVHIHSQDGSTEERDQSGALTPSQTQQSRRTTTVQQEESHLTSVTEHGSGAGLVQSENPAMVSQSAQKTQSSHATRGPGASRTITKAKDSVAESSKPKRTAGGNKRKRDSDSDRQSQKVRKDLREKLAAAQQTRTHKQQKIDEFLEELNAGPPQWAVQRGPARVEKWRRDQEQRIKRYEGELQSVNAKRADLEKTRIVFLALKDYYGKRHGDEKKFRDLLAAGYDNPIGVVAHFWLRESTEVRNALFVKCIELSAKEFEKDPQKLTQWLDAFDTVEAFDEFFELKLDENRLRRPVGK